MKNIYIYTHICTYVCVCIYLFIVFVKTISQLSFVTIYEKSHTQRQLSQVFKATKCISEL